MQIIKSLTVFIAIFFTLSFSSQVHSAISIKTEFSNDNYEEINLLQNATLTIDKNSYSLTRVSQGLRKKALFGLVPLRVYVVEFLATNPNKLNKSEDGILKSLTESGPLLLHLTFLRELPGSKIAEAFKEGLEANKISSKTMSTELSRILGEISEIKRFKKADHFTLAFSWKKDESTIFIQQNENEGKLITGSPEMAGQLLSIWFGKTSDNLLTQLKKSLIK